MPGWLSRPTPHRPIEPVPVQPAKYGRDDDIEIATERLVRGITHDLGDLVSPTGG